MDFSCDCCDSLLALFEMHTLEAQGCFDGKRFGGDEWRRGPALVKACGIIIFGDSSEAVSAGL